MAALIKVYYTKDDETKCVAEFNSESLMARCKHIIRKDAHECESKLEIYHHSVEEIESSINYSTE